MSNSGKLWNIKSYYTLYRQNEVLGNRAVFMGGNTPSESNVIDFVTITTAGNATDFGNLVTADQQAGGTANSIRGINLGGRQPAAGGTVDCDYITIMSQGNAADFGDATTANRGGSGASNDTTGLYAGGVQFSDRCEQFHHATTGRFVDFGNLARSAAGKIGFGSPTRGFFCAGDAGSPNDRNNEIEFFTFDSAGNGTDFADLSVAMRQGGGANNDTRAIISHANAPATTALCDVFNFVTGGNASSFGDLTQARDSGVNCGSNPTKIVFAGGYTGSANSNVIDSFQFATLGNAVDFGDLTVARHAGASGQSVSNGHGGLSGGTFQRPSVTYMPGSGRSLVMCGTTPTTGRMDLVFIPTAGATLDFGDAIVNTRYTSGASSAISGIYAGGGTPTTVNTIAQTKFASFGNASDFGDLSVTRTDGATSQCGSTTRGLFINGITPSGTNVIDYITFATVGNATDFGDSTDTRYAGASLSSPTRGIYAGGAAPSPGVIDYTTISSTGNATDFGDTTAVKGYAAAGASDTRGLVMGGASPSIVATIDYITIASTGNAQDFGDLSVARSGSSGTSNNIRGMAYTGRTPSITASIDFVTIASLGNGTDYGDLSLAREYPATGSDSHGGLQSA
jgi:hypothetical protein